MSTAVWMVMWSEPEMLAPLRGWAGPNSLIMDMRRPGMETDGGSDLRERGLKWSKPSTRTYYTSGCIGGIVARAIVARDGSKRASRARYEASIAKRRSRRSGGKSAMAMSRTLYSRPLTVSTVHIADAIFVDVFVYGGRVVVRKSEADRTATSPFAKRADSRRCRKTGLVAVSGEFIFRLFACAKKQKKSRLLCSTISPSHPRPIFKG